MSFPVHCPLCGRSGRVPVEQRGKCVRCPRCRHTFRAEPDAEELPALCLDGRSEEAADAAGEGGDLRP
jgi:hypothetical protein